MAEALGLSYWLEIPTAQSSFFHITAEDFFVFNDGNLYVFRRAFRNSAL
jgi:hypothetical protein